LRLLAGLFLMLAVAGCTIKQEEHSEAKGRKISDRSGNTIWLSHGPLRVMALSPAITEMLFALLPDSCIIAVTPHCNHPADRVKNKTRVSVMPLDFEKILALKPTLVLTEQGITSLSDLQRLNELGVPVLSFSYSGVADVLAAMDSIRSWTRAGFRAEFLCDSLRKELNQLEARVAMHKGSDKKSILALTWTDPIFAYGFNTWMTDKMRLAGGRNVLGEVFQKPYPVLEREQVLKLNPEVLFGGSFGQMDSSFFRMNPELKQIKAYRQRAVYELNDDLASRPGPRFMEGIHEIRNFLLKTGKDSVVR
jgi:iron complex transport system substrate-binding protein